MKLQPTKEAQNLVVYLSRGIVDAWVAGSKIVFADKHLRPISIQKGETVLEALHRVFGKCVVEVY